MLVWPRSNNIVDMSYWDYNPVVARDVLKTAIKKWRIETERRIVRATTNNKEMIEAQLKQSEDRLSSTSAAVLAFKQKHPEATDEMYAELRSRRDDLIKTRTTNMQKVKGLADASRWPRSAQARYPVDFPQRKRPPRTPSAGETIDWPEGARADEPAAGVHGEAPEGDRAAAQDPDSKGHERDGMENAPAGERSRPRANRCGRPGATWSS